MGRNRDALPTISRQVEQRGRTMLHGSSLFFGREGIIGHPCQRPSVEGFEIWRVVPLRDMAGGHEFRLPSALPPLSPENAVVQSDAQIPLRGGASLPCPPPTKCGSQAEQQ